MAAIQESGHEIFPDVIRQFEDGKVIIDAFSEAEIEFWWPVYDEPFKEINRKFPCRQSFTKEEFADAMVSPTMAKLAYVEEGEIISMCLLSNDFEHFPWMSKDFYADKYPEEYENEQVYYFVSLLTNPEKQGQLNAVKVVDFITELYELDGNEAVITFDCCPDNVKSLPGMISWAVDNTGIGELQLDEIGTQHYFAGKLALNSVTDLAE